MNNQAPTSPTALQWYKLGHTPLPVRPDGTKAPTIAWRAWQNQRPTIDEIERAFTIDHDGLGVLTGTPRTDNTQLLMIEAEGRAVAEGVVNALATAMADHNAADLWARISGGYAELTPSGGIHWYVLVDGPAGRNTKLARRPATAAELEKTPDTRVQVLLETRGEGGFSVIAPSAGRTHPTGQPWRTIAGTPETIPTVTVAERDILFAVASTLDQMPDPTPQPSQPSPSPPGSPPNPTGDRPGDHYNRAGDWSILERHGWQIAWRHGRLIGWTRPGKRISDGISATTGRDPDADRFYCFSTSTRFDAETPYSRLGVLATLEHNGDHSSAAKALAKQGWGGSTHQRAADETPGRLDGIITPPPKPSPQPEGPVATPITSATQDRPRTDGTSAIAVDEAPVISLDLARYGPTEDGLARALIDRHSDDLRYCPQRSSWLRWDGHRWQWDDAGHHRELIKGIARQLPDNDTWVAHRKRMLTARGVAGVASLAATDAAVVTPASLLDADPWVLNTPTGIADLRDGSLRPTRPSDLCTRITSTPYDPAATAPRWEMFLLETFDGDAEMVAYLQRMIGYSAVGAVTHHVLPFAHGGGGNGKSVTLEVAMGVLGSYASSAPAGFLMSGRQDESAVARLSGLRMVVCSEINERDRLDEAKMKLLTGGDTLTSRFLFGQYFDFTPTHHLWLMGNHKPRIESGGEGVWRRMRLLPFTHQVPEEKRIEGLARQLQEEEGPGILAWIVQGAVAALSHDGLADPDGVKLATAAYAEEEDALARFAADRIMVSSGAREDTSVVRRAYAAWCRAEGEQEVSSQVFGRELRTRWGVTVGKSNGRRMYEGIMLLSDADESDDDSDPRGRDWHDR